jgi:hypothetical protein
LLFPASWLVAKLGESPVSLLSPGASASGLPLGALAGVKAPTRPFPPPRPGRTREEVLAKLATKNLGLNSAKRKK